MTHRGRRQRLIDMIIANSHAMRPIVPPFAPRTEEIPGIRHIVFDVYGTLVTSGAGEIGIDPTAPTAKNQAFQLVADRYGDRDLSGKRVESLFFDRITAAHERLRSTAVPQPDLDIRTVWRDVAEELFPGPLNPETIEEIALTYELTANPVALMPQTRNVLDTLSVSYPLGIVSNAQFYTPLILSTLLKDDLRRWFDRTVWSFEIEIAKPSPAIFERYVTLLSDDGVRPVSPGEVLYVGNDMRNDVSTARDAGWRTVLFAGDTRSLRLRDPNHQRALAIPDAVITSLNQIFSVIPERPSTESKGRTT